MKKRSIALLGGLGLCAAIDLATATTLANGVFPSAGQIVIDPSDPLHLVVRTTYGVLTTRSGGEPWDWICEGGVGYSSGFHPAVAVTEDGSVIAGVPDGISVTHAEMCSWVKASGPSSGAVIVDVSIDKQTPSRAVAVSAKNGATPARLWISEDNAVTWTQAGSDLPAGYSPLSVDLAPSDPSRVYVSALIGGGSTFKGSLIVSSNGGQTWQQFSVPQTDGDHGPYIGAVDPSDADRVYLRSDGSPGRLFVFDYKTVKVTELYVGIGYLRGFALSPDGTKMLVGGSSDGILRAATAMPVFEQMSKVTTRCLTWTAAGVYSCATEFADGFTVGLSQDEGATFEPLMHLPCVRGPLECGPETSAGKACPAEWPAVAVQIGKSKCPDGMTGSTGSGGGVAGATGAAAGSAGSAGAGGAAGVAGTPGAGGGLAGSGGASAGAAAAPPDKGCSCDLAAGSSSRRGALATIAALLLVVCLRGHRRANSPA